MEEKLGKEGAGTDLNQGGHDPVKEKIGEKRGNIFWYCPFRETFNLPILTICPDGWAVTPLTS